MNMKKLYFSPEVEVDLIVVEGSFMGTYNNTGQNLDPEQDFDPWADD